MLRELIIIRKGRLNRTMFKVIKSLFEKCSVLLPDEIYIKAKYRYHLGKRLDLTNPKSFNEKIQWLKIHDRRPEYTNYVDKYAVRKYVSETIGEKYLIPLLGVYDDVKAIDWSKLPDKFVLKCTHGSGCNIICADKSKLDIAACKKKLQMWMKRNWYWYGREWPYKNVKPRIICEKYMVDESGNQLKDYKIFCFHGEPKIIQVDYDRFTNHKRNLYDTQWNYINASIHFPSDPTVKIKKPDKLEDMLQLAKTLAKDYPHVRVDFYYTDGNIYFGELTFYHGSGIEKFQPEEFGELMGSWIKLPIRSS